MTRPNRDLDQAGHTLQSVIALNLTNALEHIARELSILDGFPERGEQANVQATSELTSVERHADARYALTEARETLRDHKAQVLQSIRELNEYINVVMRMRQPRNVTQPKAKEGLCCSNQAGKAGAIEEWGDALCLDMGMSNRGGLCYKHWMAWYRYRKATGVDTSKDFEPA